VDLLRGEIQHLEKARVAGQNEDLSSFDRFVQGYRHTIYDDQLVAKKAELEAALPVLEALEQKDPKPPPIRPARQPRAGPRKPLPIRRVAIILAPLLLLGLVAVGVARNQGRPEDSYRPFELAPVTRRPMREPGEKFFTREVPVLYAGGQMIISGEPPVTGQFWVDDKITLTVTHPDGSVASWEKIFNNNCFDNRAAPPEDITHLFRRGENKVLVEMFDVCGADVGTLNKVLLTEI
jgi:hypothetical protein